MEDLYVGELPTDNADDIVSDIIQYGEVEAAAAAAPYPTPPQSIAAKTASESGLGTSIASSEMDEREKKNLTLRQTRGMTKKAGLTAADRVADLQRQRREEEQRDIERRSRSARQPFAVRPLPNEGRQDYQRRAREFYREYQTQGDVGDLPYLKPPSE